MPDIADDRAAFLEAMPRAEEASGITRDVEGNEVYAEVETPVATPELEGAVPVQASDQPLDSEPAAEADTPEEQPAEPAAEPTVEELKAELAAAQARIEEQKTMIGRQSAEVGTTREEIAALKAQLEARLDAMASTHTAPAAPSVAITQDMIDNSPAFAVQAAFDQKNPAALEMAYKAWSDPLHPMGDPTAAQAWLFERKLEQQQASFEARIAEQEKRLESVSAPLVQATSSASGAWRSMR